MLDKLKIVRTDEVTTLRYESASVELRPYNDTQVLLSSLFARERRKGHATMLMVMVTVYADENQMPLYLEARRYGHPIGPDTKQLVEFYKEFGFKVVDEGPGVFMERPSQELHGIL